MTRPDWRTLVLLAIFFAAWWLPILARGCGPLRPTEQAPAGQQTPDSHRPLQ
jgi:hypothetical protein